MDHSQYHRENPSGDRLLTKQLAKQVLRNRIFVGLLLLLIALTSASYFFVRFSIDGNLAALEAMPVLTGNQQDYQTALTSNIYLGNNFLLSFTGLTAFVFTMFFYRFFRANRKQVGCLKSLGFRDSAIRRFFVQFTAILSLIGGLLGLAGGYFLSSMQLHSNMRSYQVTGLIKSVTPTTTVIGLFAPMTVFCAVAFLCYGLVRGKEAGALIADNAGSQSYGFTLRAANAVSSIIPVKNKAPYRIALRKPIAVLLVFIAVMSFSVCMFIGQSLYISSRTVHDSQMLGHDYEYELQYDYVRFNAGVDAGALPYLEMPGVVAFGSYALKQSAAGFYALDEKLVLQDSAGQPVPLPADGEVVIGPGLQETYGLSVGDAVTVMIKGNSLQLKVVAVAVNAKSATVYLNADEMASMLGLPPGSHNGDLRTAAPTYIPDRVTVITRQERTEQLARDMVSNNVSGIINQGTGMLVGCILLFLALFISFQDNTRDMLILHMPGYRNKAIRGLLVNVYFPIVWAAFFITLAPSIWLARSIQRSLSVAMNDYMPFGISVWVVLVVFVILNIIYLLVQAVFGLGIRRTIRKEDITEYTSAE